MEREKRMKFLIIFLANFMRRFMLTLNAFCTFFEKNLRRHLKEFHKTSRIFLNVVNLRSKLRVKSLLSEV